jgi:2-dehydropantoate 2-reductase
MRRFVGGARGGKPPSLRLHLLAGGGPSEVAWLNGAVAAEGARLGVPTPVNAALAQLVDEAAADPARWAQLRGHPERLLARVQGAG